MSVSVFLRVCVLCVLCVRDDGVRVWWCGVGVHGLCHVIVCVTQHRTKVRKLFLDSVGGGVWPFLVGGLPQRPHHDHTACTHKNHTDEPQQHHTEKRQRKEKEKKMKENRRDKRRRGRREEMKRDRGEER